MCIRLCQIYAALFLTCSCKCFVFMCIYSVVKIVVHVVHGVLPSILMCRNPLTQFCIIFFLSMLSHGIGFALTSEGFLFGARSSFLGCRVYMVTQEAYLRVLLQSIVPKVSHQKGSAVMPMQKKKNYMQEIHNYCCFER